MVILLAEDDVGVQFFIWKLLKADGYTVLTAGDGEAGLEASRNHPGPIDLLLTDLEMPRMDGQELYRRIASERPGIKVLMMSGALAERERVSMNGLPFLQKPFTATALRDAIQVALGPKMCDGFHKTGKAAKGDAHQIAEALLGPTSSLQ